MSTNAVPGANPKNRDYLERGAWAEDKDQTSLVHVIGREDGSIVFQIYDLSEDPIIFYQNALIESEFKTFFSVPPVGTSDVTWTWHDKTDFPFDRVMKRFSSKASYHADVKDQLSVAQRIAAALHIKGKRLTKEDVSAQVEREHNRGMAIIDVVTEALGKIRDTF